MGANPDHDVFVIASTGGAEIPVMEEMNREIVLGWAPDGAHLLVGSYRTGTTGAWLVPVKDGRPAGTALLQKDNLGDAYPMGFDNKGAYYYNINPGGGHQVFTPPRHHHPLNKSPTPSPRRSFHGPARLLGHGRIDDRLNLANRIRR